MQIYIGGRFSILYLILTIFMIYGLKWFMIDVVKIYVPLKYVVIRPRDQPWMNSEVPELFLFNVIGYITYS